MLQRLLPPALFAALALLLCRAALVPDKLLGTWSGEGWGRIFVTLQLTRWLRGEAPVGRADLLSWPTGSPLWPILRRCIISSSNICRSASASISAAKWKAWERTSEKTAMRSA